MKTRDQMSPAELKAAMEAYRKRNDAEEVRLAAAKRAASKRTPVDRLPVEPRREPVTPTVNYSGMLSPDTAPFKPTYQPSVEDMMDYTQDIDQGFAFPKGSKGFNPVIEEIFENEGGYQKKEKDEGNYNSKGELVGTNHGISAPTYEKILGRPPTEQDMKDITQEEAAEIYEEEYIAPVKEKLKVEEDHPAYQQLVDMQVQEGYGVAAAIIQRAVGAKVDGKVGPETRKKIAAMNPIEFNNALVEERIAEKKRRAKSDPRQEEFLEGWLGRFERYRIDEDSRVLDNPISPISGKPILTLVKDALAAGGTKEDILKATKNHPAVVKFFEENTQSLT